MLGFGHEWKITSSNLQLILVFLLGFEVELHCVKFAIDTSFCVRVWTRVEYQFVKFAKDPSFYVRDLFLDFVRMGKSICM